MKDFFEGFVLRLSNMEPDVYTVSGGAPENEGKWFFDDENEFEHGPFDTEDEAIEALNAYARDL
jgi:hypothetical protein